MEQVLVKIYNIFPKNIRQKIGRSKFFTFLRNFVLKKGKVYRESYVFIKRHYGTYKVRFKFYASIKTAAKAKKSGIENTIINNSIYILNKFKKHDNDCIVLDIGSNFGYLSLVWSQTISKNNGKIIAFEPNIEVIKSLEKSIFDNNLKSIISTENLAVGNKTEVIKLYLNNTTSNVIESNSNQNHIQIDMIKIDSYFKDKLKKCDLVKIDVDGIEFDILNGSRELIKEFHPIFIVETNNDNRIIEFFIQQNYKILNMKLKPIIEGELPLNVFCIPKL